MKHLSNPNEPEAGGSSLDKHRCSNFLSYGGGLILTLAVLGQAWGATLTVCPTAGPGCNYTSVQAAVAAANAGDTVQVQAGTFTENGRFIINKNLTISGAGPYRTTVNNTIIQPAGGTEFTDIGTGWWEIRSGVTLNLTNLVLDGRAEEEITTPGSGAKLRTALHFAGNGVVDGVAIRNVGHTVPISGGSLALGWAIMQDYETSGSMALTVRNAGISNFGGTAIQTDAGNRNLNADLTPRYPSTVVVENNEISCSDGPFINSSSPPDNYLQYGVTATGGADVTITGNSIIGCRGTVACTVGSGEATDTYCGDSSAILAQSTFAKGTRVTASNNFIDNNFTGLTLDVYDFDRGPWIFTKNSFPNLGPIGIGQPGDLAVYFIAGPQSATDFPGINLTNNWWGENVDPRSEPYIVDAGGPFDYLTTSPWIATFDLDNKPGPGFWPINITNWKVQTDTVNNGTLSPAFRFVADGAKASFTAMPDANSYIANDTFSFTGNCNGGGLTGSTWNTGAITDNTCVVNAEFKPKVAAVDGVCGGDNGLNLTSTPTNLCTAGIPSAVNGNGPWNWTCAGTVGTEGTGTTASCLANLASYPVTGQVGSGSGTITPFNVRVAHGGATSFTLTSAVDSVINNVSGCGGTLNGNLFTTGPITAACTVTATFAATNTTTTITSVAPSPSAVGQLVTVNFSVSNAGSLNDTVTVTDNAGNSCTGTVGGGSCVITFGTPGARTLIANYSAPTLPAQPSSSAGRNHVVADQPVLATLSVPGGVVGALYSQPIVASGGVPPYTFSATGLPAGLALSAGGLLSGIPTTPGPNDVVVTVTDALLQTGTNTYPLNVINTLAITTPSLPDGNLPNGLINSPYAMTLAAAGGTPPYTWDVQAGSTLPSGIILNATTGALSGTPTDLGTSPEFIVQVQDSSTTPITATARFTLTNLAPDLIESDNTGNAVSANLALDNSIPTCVVDATETFVIGAAAYGANPPNPPGTTLVNGLFKISLQGCTPGEAKLTVKLVYPNELEPGSQYWKYGKTADNPTDHWYPLPNAVIEGNTITFTITDGGLGDDDLQANGSITDPGGVADPWSLTTVQTGSPVNVTLPTNIAAPDTIASCAAVAGYPLPPGLTFSCLSGQLVLTGTPTTPGIYTFAITVTGTTGGPSTEYYRLEIQQGPPVPIPTLSEWAMILVVMGMIGLVGWRHRRQDALRA